MLGEYKKIKIKYLKSWGGGSHTWPDGDACRNF